MQVFLSDLLIFKAQCVKSPMMLLAFILFETFLYQWVNCYKFKKREVTFFNLVTVLVKRFEK